MSKCYKLYGKKNGKQIYMCKDRNRRFVDNLYFERLKFDPKIICVTLDLYMLQILEQVSKKILNMSEQEVIEFYQNQLLVN